MANIMTSPLVADMMEMSMLRGGIWLLVGWLSTRISQHGMLIMLTPSNLTAPMARECVCILMNLWIEFVRRVDVEGGCKTSSSVHHLFCDIPSGSSSVRISPYLEPPSKSPKSFICQAHILLKEGPCSMAVCFI